MSQPLGKTADYEILQTRRTAPDLVLACLSVEFLTDRPPLPVFLAVLAVATHDGNGAAHHQVSKLD